MLNNESWYSFSKKFTLYHGGNKNGMLLKDVDALMEIMERIITIGLSIRMIHLDICDGMP